jgi:hypothetical protein
MSGYYPASMKHAWADIGAAVRQPRGGIRPTRVPALFRGRPNDVDGLQPRRSRHRSRLSKVGLVPFCFGASGAVGQWGSGRIAPVR